MNLHRSTDRGKTFTEILDWSLYDNGDRAQHGDQHAILFDWRSSRQVWIGNDGGISFTADYMTLAAPSIPGIVHAPTAQWRKRSYGIGAAQFTAIASHPRFPFICGGGMQDNGTFVSYGGPSWYRLDGGDGGQMAFHPSNPRQYFTTSQDGIDPVQILDHSSPYPFYRSTLPDVDPPGNVMVPSHGARLVFPSPANDPVFVGIVEADPTTPGRLLIGRKGAGFYTLNGNATPPTLTPFTPALSAIPPAPSSTVPPPPPTPDEVSAMAFSPGGNDVWVGTLGGLVFRFTAAPGVALPVSPPPPPIGSLPGRAAAILQGVGAARVNAIVVHPQNPSVVAVGVNWEVVFLSHDGGQNWANINGSGSSLPSSRITSLAFDPGNTQVIFAGTMAGVWVARNLPLPTGAAIPGATFDAEWKTYSAGLPPVQVNDLEVTPIKNTLRCATFGRGAFEAELPPATPVNFRIPEVRLMIRSNPIDDGYVRDRPGGNPVYPNLFFDDPRLPVPPAPAGPAPDFDYKHALDIRIDAPGFIRSEAFAFGEAIDGVEFDETLVSDKPLAGDINRVYVQVHNRGFGAAAKVKVSLYFAKANHAPAPAGPLTPPDIDNRINYPGDPAADSPWKLASSQTLGALAPGEPTVVRFDWLAPLELTDGVALMAVCSNDKDQLAAIPAGDPAAFIKAERRAALRITAVNRDTVYIRDGVDDDARPGGVAWGGRSPDLIVVQAAVANPDDPAGPFKDLNDQRTSDVVKAGANFIYVRIFNRTRVAVNAKVKIYALPVFDLADTAGRTKLPPKALLEVAVNAIAPHGWKFAAFNWNGVTDPDPANASAYKGFLLLAMASVVDAAGVELDPYPDSHDVTDLESFWRFFKSGPLANNAAVRALRFQP